MTTASVQLIHGDCLEVMPTLPPGSVQMVFADLPYGVTSCAWDVLIPLRQFCSETTRIAGKSGCQAFSAVQPFTTAVMNEMMALFRQEICWVRASPRGFQSAKKRLLRGHENILLFARTATTYNPIKTAALRKTTVTPYCRKSEVYGGQAAPQPLRTYTDRFPTTVLQVPETDLRHDTLNGHKSKRIHPTQKPVALLEWLIRTYTNEGDTVLDPTAGSMTTAIAALRAGRNAICIEKNSEYFRAGSERVEAEKERLLAEA